MSSTSENAKWIHLALYLWIGWGIVVVGFCANYYLTAIDVGSPIRPESEISETKLKASIEASTNLSLLKKQCGYIAEKWDWYRDSIESQWKRDRESRRTQFAVLFAMGSSTSVACFFLWRRLRQLAGASVTNGL